MNQDDFKKLLDEALEPIKKTQEEHTAILKSHTEILNSHTKTLNSHTKTLNSHTKTLNSHTETLRTLKSSVLTIETTIEAYGDMYKINNDNARRLEKRVEALEENTGIEPPPELVLLKVR